MGEGEEGGRETCGAGSQGGAAEEEEAPAPDISPVAGCWVFSADADVAAAESPHTHPAPSQLFVFQHEAGAEQFTAERVLDVDGQPPANRQVFKGTFDAASGALEWSMSRSPPLLQAVPMNHVHCGSRFQNFNVDSETGLGTIRSGNGPAVFTSEQSVTPGVSGVIAWRFRVTGNDSFSVGALAEKSFSDAANQLHSNSSASMVVNSTGSSGSNSVRLRMAGRRLCACSKVQPEC